LIFAGVVVLFRVFGEFSYGIDRSCKFWVLVPVLLLGGWQIVSITWNDRDADMRWYSLLQSLLMCAALTSGVLLASGLPFASRVRLARWVAMVVTAITAVYAGLSFVFPGWRPSASGMDIATQGLGFIRLFGPLGTATTLNFILTPILGLCVGMMFLPRTFKPFWAVMSLFIVVCILATGSRGGLVCFAALAFFLVVRVRLRSLLFLGPVILTLVIVVMLAGVPERFRHLEDQSRFATYATALRAWIAQSENVILGTGHGALYSKLHDDALRSFLNEDRWFLLDEETPFGYTLRNSHSALVRSLAETGPLGFLLQCAPLVWILGRLLLPRYGHVGHSATLFARSVLAGCAATIPYMALEEFFVSAFWIVTLWTMFVVIGAETAADAAQPAIPL